MTDLEICYKCIDDMTNDLLVIADVLEEHQVNVKLDNGRYLNPVSAIRSKVSVIWEEVQSIAAWNARAERTCERVLYKPTGVLVCSECGAGMPKQLDKYCYLNYCPNCGAKVIGG